MPNYSVFGGKSTDNVQAIIQARSDASTVGRGYVYDYVVGNNATPADNVYDHILARSSTAGTKTDITPSPLDPANPASIFDASGLYTVDPTLGVNLYRFPLNARATFRWVAAPGSELIWPATASNGITGGLLSASTSTFSATMLVNSF
jgi:hypothetical protein